MSRGSIPRFDLYEELEISRLASAEVIDAAYRALVKRHHPDVSTPADVERIKRLNVARDWLTSPTRRARYDAATGGPGERLAGTAAAGMGPTAERTAPTDRRPGPRSSGAPTGGVSEPARPARPSSPASFGIHSREVRQFLAHLRTLDAARAQELVDGRAALDPRAYAAARSASLAASRDARNHEWTFAREAASVIARGKLPYAPNSVEVVAIVADIAGAIVVRDLLSTADFRLLLAPWTWRDHPAAAADASRPGTGGLGGVPPGTVRPSAWRPGPARPALAMPALALPALALPALPGAAGLSIVSARVVAAARARPPVALGIAAAVVAVLALAMLGGGQPTFESGIATLTSPPESAASRSPGDQPGVSSAPTGPGVGWLPSAAPSGAGPGSSEAPGLVATPQPAATPPPRSTATPRPTVVATPSAPPTAASTPSPSPGPTAPPTPSPAPTPQPTPSPQADCTVPNLVNRNSSEAQALWAGAGFTGSVLFSPQPPPQYKIGWQSLAAGSAAPCTSDITVQQLAP